MSNKCPECIKQGLKSFVYPEMCAVTAMACPTFYDEEGRMHKHDSNIRTQHFSCSQGHSWQEEEKGSCWCGWPNNDKYENQGSFTLRSSEDNSVASIKKGVDGVEYF